MEVQWEVFNHLSSAELLLYLCPVRLEYQHFFSGFSQKAQKSVVNNVALQEGFKSESGVFLHGERMFFMVHAFSLGTPISSHSPKIYKVD